MSYTQTEFDCVVRGFEERTLPKEHWTHDAHLIVAFYYVSQYGMDKALCLMRSGIILYNHAAGGVSDEKEGYHETLTCFWVRAIHHYLQRKGTLAAPFADELQMFLSSPEAGREWPLQYYSKQYLMSVEARASFVEPDIRPLF